MLSYISNNIYTNIFQYIDKMYTVHNLIGLDSSNSHSVVIPHTDGGFTGVHTDVFGQMSEVKSHDHVMWMATCIGKIKMATRVRIQFYKFISQIITGK